ncbi:MAG TPA: alpha-amylase family glycosyl hydrolase [Patescibacteria group bacterium]|nr:alpha-amylase family glycosyl hydrolase [Patescibacteria group bacterium]
MEKIIPYLQQFYLAKDIERIVSELERYARTLPTVKPKYFTNTWYKNSNIYSVYPDGVSLHQEAPLTEIKDYLTTIRKLGCNAIHLLPFLKSPMQDKGYDVSDYYSVREGLGGMESLKALKKAAEEQEIHIFMDLIFNHVSIEHEWFMKAEQGSEYYRNFFLHTKETPQFLRKIEKDSTVYAEYLVNGEKTLVSVAFPEFAGELPHWRQGKDGYWYYHTYYPHQIDLNWQNPDVFIELSKILLFWASKGFNFRFDAIQFIGKTAYKHLDTHNPFTHHLTSVFNVIAESVFPECIFIFETFEHLDSVIEYFGTANNQQSKLLYSFHFTASLWISLLEENQSHIWKQLKSMSDIPIHAQWVNFLRNHDELSLAYVDKTILEKVHTKLIDSGKPFRSEFGISGRTYSLLASDEKRFLMSYFLLSSMPGSIMIPYGDEFGMGNIAQSQLSEEEKKDTRNINRGVVTTEIIKSKKGELLFAHLATIFKKRQIFRDYLNIWPEELPVAQGIFGATYKKGTSEFLIFINLTPARKTVHFDDIAAYAKILEINNVDIENNNIKLDTYAGIWLQK